MNTNANKIIELIQDIPSEQFTSFEFTNGIDKCCVVGHVVRLTSDDPNDYSHQNCSRYEGNPLLTDDTNAYDLAAHNNGHWSKAIGSNEKERSINYLKTLN